MFEALRKLNGLSRNELAIDTRRSVNYILKAEQATFPHPPIALLDYYVKQGHDKEVLASAYRDFQRRKRIAWLEDYAPDDYTAGLPFRKKWLKRQVFYGVDSAVPGATGVGVFSSPTGFLVSNPTQYGISVGLCLPAAVIYRNDKDLTHAGAICTAMEDLCDFVTSGKHRAEYLSYEQAAEEELSILRIAREEGVKANGLAA